MPEDLPAWFQSQYSDDPPSFYGETADTIEILAPTRVTYEGEITRHVRSTLLRAGVWMLSVFSIIAERADYRRVIPGTRTLLATAYLYYAEASETDWVVHLLTVGDDSDLYMTWDLLCIYARELELEILEYDPDLRPTVQRVEIARRGFFPHLTVPYRIAIPLFVIDEYLWGLGPYLESYFAWIDLIAHISSPPRIILYYCMVVGGARVGDRALQLVEFLRSIYPSSDYRYGDESLSFWDTIDRGLRAFERDYTGGLRDLFSEDRFYRPNSYSHIPLLQYWEVRDYSIAIGDWRPLVDHEDPEDQWQEELDLWDIEFEQRPILLEERLQQIRAEEEAEVHWRALQGPDWDLGEEHVIEADWPDQMRDPHQDVVDIDLAAEDDEEVGRLASAA